MNTPTEKDLDRALDDAFSKNAAFAEWFINQTKFAGQGAVRVWSRSNNPWGQVTVEVENAKTGEREVITREGETDILVVFETRDKRRVALHIENKRSGGRFTPHQPAVYAARAEAWRANPKYGNYEDWETVLVAPNAFRERFAAIAGKFGRFVAHEQIAFYIPAFNVAPDDASGGQDNRPLT